MWFIDQFYVGCGTFFFFYRVMEIQFTNHTIYPLKMNNSVIFSIFTALCNHRHSLISEHFHHLKKKPHPNKEAVCNIPLPHGCWQHWSTSFLTLRICLFYTFSRQSLCDCTSLCVVLGFFFPSFSSSTFSFFVQINIVWTWYFLTWKHGTFLLHPPWFFLALYKLIQRNICGKCVHVSGDWNIVSYELYMIH